MTGRLTLSRPAGRSSSARGARVGTTLISDARKAATLPQLSVASVLPDRLSRRRHNIHLDQDPRPTARQRTDPSEFARDDGAFRVLALRDIV